MRMSGKRKKEKKNKKTYYGIAKDVHVEARACGSLRWRVDVDVLRADADEYKRKRRRKNLLC